MKEAGSRRRGFAGRLPEDIRSKLGGVTEEGEGLTVIDFPCHVLDKEGKIILLYLPGFLRLEKEEALCLAVAQLAKVPEPQLVTKKDGHWRAQDQYFHPNPAGLLPVGVASYSPCWFTMGHPVGTLILIQSLLLTGYCVVQGSRFPAKTVRHYP
jgi:hypothetical protein